jgi:hypothetical protein
LQGFRFDKAAMSPRLILERPTALMRTHAFADYDGLALIAPDFQTLPRWSKYAIKFKITCLGTCLTYLFSLFDFIFSRPIVSKVQRR